MGPDGDMVIVGVGTVKKHIDALQSENQTPHRSGQFIKKTDYDIKSIIFKEIPIS